MLTNNSHTIHETFGPAYKFLTRMSLFYVSNTCAIYSHQLDGFVLSCRHSFRRRFRPYNTHSIIYMKWILSSYVVSFPLFVGFDLPGVESYSCGNRILWNGVITFPFK